jgi:hypothetical protein
MPVGKGLRDQDVPPLLERGPRLRRIAIEKPPGPVTADPGLATPAPERLKEEASQKPEDGGQKAEDGGQKSEDGRPKAEADPQPTSS